MCSLRFFPFITLTRVIRGVEMLTRKHFREIASILDNFSDNINKQDIVEALSKYLKSQNGRFSSLIFEDACYFSDDE